MLNEWRYAIPTTLLFGEKSFEELAQEVKNAGLKQGLLMIDPFLREIQAYKGLEQSFAAMGLPLEIFSEIEPNPRMSSLIKAHCLFIEKGCDYIIGFGGGSSIDAAKGVGILATNPGPLFEYKGRDQYANPPCPIFAIPTTAGTGSEVSWSCVFFDDVNNRKVSVLSRKHAPRLAVLNPSLLTSLPPRLIASTGADVLVHAAESFVSILATPMTVVHSAEALKGVVAHLKRFYTTPVDISAAAGMQIACVHAGIAFGQARLGVAHALSHPVEKLFKVPHGTACSCVFPAVMRFARSGNVPQFAEIARIFLKGGSPALTVSMDDEEGLSLIAADLVEAFLNDIGIPTKLDGFINDGDANALCEQIVEAALFTGNHKTSPVVPEADDLRTLVRSLM